MARDPRSFDGWGRRPAARWGVLAVVVYGCCIAAFVIGFRLRGLYDYDRTGAVVVTEGFPAARSGMVSGDRLLAIGGRPILRFADIRPALAATPEGTFEVTIERAGERSTLSVSFRPSDGRKLGVGLPVIREEVDLASTFVRSALEPAAVWRRAILNHELSMEMPPDAAGPVTFAEYLRQREPGDTVVSFGMFLSYVLPFPLALAVLLFVIERVARRGHGGALHPEG